MNYILNNIQLIMITRLQKMKKKLFQLFVTSMFMSILSCSSSIQPDIAYDIDPVLQQAVYKTAEDAANSFVWAVKQGDEEQLREILGADFRNNLLLGGISGTETADFIKAWEETHTLVTQDSKKEMLVVGKGQWVLPIPIVKEEKGWYFDIKEGLERIRIRRIGKNELATMQAVLAYYDAQMEYAEQDRNGNHILEYAQKFISTPGTHDGLYWETKNGEDLSPLGPLLANRKLDGGYHGYFYRILNAQGEHKKGDAYSYLIDGKMRAGFAMIAWPKVYGETGVMSFMVSHSGIVYEKNLGVDGASIAEKILTYNPSNDWLPTKEVSILFEKTQ